MPERFPTKALVAVAFDVKRLVVDALSDVTVPVALISLAFMVYA